MTLTDKKKVMFVRPERERARKTVIIHEMCFKNWKNRKVCFFWLEIQGGKRLPGKSKLRQAAQPPNPVFFWRMESVVNHHDLENLGKAV